MTTTTTTDQSYDHRHATGAVRQYRIYIYIYVHVHIAGQEENPRPTGERRRSGERTNDLECVYVARPATQCCRRRRRRDRIRKSTQQHYNGYTEKKKSSDGTDRYHDTRVALSGVRVDTAIVFARRRRLYGL